MTTEDFKKYNSMFTEKKCCIIIPTFNNCQTIGKIIDETLKYTNQVIVVNDGSTDATNIILQKFPAIDIINYSSNKGKGFALRKAFKYAFEKGYKYAITIDSDGQHKTEDYTVFMDKLNDEPEAIIIGARNMNHASVPGKSNFGRKFSNFWFRVETGIKLQDTQSGFRLYPLEPLNRIWFFTNKYEFEIEVIVRAAWKGIKILSVPIEVYYAPKESRISHFRPFWDFSRVSILNSILVFLAFLYFRPLLFFRKIKRTGPKQFIKQHLLHSNDSAAKLALSVGIGVITGILPIWGYQLILAIALAYSLKLNKIITIAAANISLPPMIPIIIYGSFQTGKLILGNNLPSIQYSANLDFEFIKNNIQQYIVGSITMAFIAGIVFGLMTYVLLIIFRKKRKIITN